MTSKHRWLYRRFAWRDAEARRIVAAIRAQEILDDLARIRAKRARVVEIRERRKKFLGVTKLREQPASRAIGITDPRCRYHNPGNV